MKVARLQRWLKLALALNVLIVILAGGFGTIWLWAMLPYSPPYVDREAVLAKYAATFLGAPLILIACLTIAARELDRRNLAMPAYLLMALPVFVAPFLFWESLR